MSRQLLALFVVLGSIVSSLRNRKSYDIITKKIHQDCICYEGADIMSDYVGVIELKQTIPCRKEVSGQTFKSKIANHDVLIIFPSIPDDYDPQKGPDIQKGDLVVPCDWFRDDINWGTINAWPNGLFSVKHLLCYISGTENIIHEVYADFPRWKEKLNNLLLINAGDYLLPKQEIPALIQGGGFYDGLQLFEVTKGKPLQRVRNSRATEPIKLRFVETKESYTNQKMSDLFAFVGNKKEIALAYELLITAYRAMERNDFRSAVILGGSALEQAILNRMRQEYPSKTKFKKAKGNPNHRMLSGKFHWLAEKKISIPILDYKKTIIDVRNNATHDGIRPTYAETKLCLENCKILIGIYNPDVLETQ